MLNRVPHRGELWFAYTPGQPTDPHQPRPALIISENSRNFRRHDVLVIPIFSEGFSGPTRVPIHAGVGGLPHDSLAFCEEITNIDRDFLAGGPLGPPVSTDILDHLLRAVRRALGDPVPEPWST